ncbi:MAG TPA: glycosyltransferase family 2 protein [Rhabdaerophilum sp.]|nr:glycosyltransferase family 2 protein [Rhabdaerophilum sp.]
MSFPVAPSSETPVRVLVTICTRNRPILLDQCLASVCASEPAEGAAFEIAVIENNDRLTCEEIAARHQAASGIRVHCVLEPELGLPFARNRCGTYAAANGFDWLLYIDDDEVAQPDWFRTMMAATKIYPADVFYGRVISIYPEGTPAYLRERSINKRPTGTSMTKAEGHNTLVRTAIFAEDGDNLRFDTSMRFTGGSDTDFFSRVAAKGRSIVWIGEAIVEELVPETRMTLGWQLNRTFRVAVNLSVLKAKKEGKAAAAFFSLVKGTGRLLGGVLSLPLGALALVMPDKGRRWGFKALKQIASGLGSYAYLFGVRPQPYRKVDGA